MNILVSEHTVLIRGVTVTGDTLEVDVSVSNPGPAAVVDVFFGALLPPTAGLPLGCPRGDPVVFFVNNRTATVPTCLTAPPQTFPPLFQKLALPANLPLTTLTDFLSVVWPRGATGGTYTVFVALTPPGAFAEGRLVPSALSAFATATLDFEP